MKKLYTILLTTALAFNNLPKVNINAEIPKDKKLHFKAGLIISGGAYFIGPQLEKLVFDKPKIHPAIWGLGIATLAGASKELIYDKALGKGDPESKDFLYTFFGGVASSFTLEILSKVFGRKNNNTLNFYANPSTKDFSFSYNFSF